MQPIISTWNFILERLNNNSAVMLLYVVESTGSSPGRQGFSMAVDVGGKMVGSIGGGMMEHKLVELAKEKLHAASENLQPGTLKKQIHNKTATVNQSGMICSGEQTVFMYQVQKKDMKSIGHLIHCINQNQCGTLVLSAHSIEFSTDPAIRKFEFDMKSENEWTFKEKVGFDDHLHIIGGGHCALALSQLMNKLNFYIHLYENRRDLHTMLLNDAVHEKKIVSEYSQLTNLVDDGQNQYIVVMTFGYRSDAEALRALSGKKFKYIGVLGSKNKIKRMLKDLKNEGLPDEYISSLHAPVGLPIKSETPEEIAVSIAAEIIRTRNVKR
jgi:xanthine dehydrogenase accessory factor